MILTAGERIQKKEHHLSLTDRTVLKAGGVSKIEFFSPEAMLVSTEQGRMAIKGNELYVDSLNAESGELLVRGQINSIAYYEKDNSGAWLKRLFK